MCYKLLGNFTNSFENKYSLFDLFLFVHINRKNYRGSLPLTLEYDKIIKQNFFDLASQFDYKCRMNVLLASNVIT